MTTEAALKLIYEALPNVKREEIAATPAAGEAILQTLWRTLHLAIQNNRNLCTPKIGTPEPRDKGVPVVSPSGGSKRPIPAALAQHLTPKVTP